MSEDISTYCTFRAAGRWFGTPIDDVMEVTAEAACTRIPHAPPEVAGYVNIRGHIFLALDLRRLLGFESPSATENRLIVFKPGVGPAFGILVDEIGDITAVPADQIEDFSGGATQLTVDEPIRRIDLIARVCRCPTELLVVLESRKFLRVVEQAFSVN